MRSNLAFLPLIGSILWFRWPLDNPLEWRCVCPWSVPLFWFWLAPDLQIGIQRSCPWLVLIKTAPDSPWISIEIIQIFGLSIFELNRTERLLFFCCLHPAAGLHPANQTTPPSDPLNNCNCNNNNHYSFFCYVLLLLLLSKHFFILISFYYYFALPSRVGCHTAAIPAF